MNPREELELLFEKLDAAARGTRTNDQIPYAAGLASGLELAQEWVAEALGRLDARSADRP